MVSSFSLLHYLYQGQSPRCFVLSIVLLVLGEAFVNQSFEHGQIYADVMLTQARSIPGSCPKAGFADL